MQSLSEVFEQPCKICGCKMEIVKELENINDLSRGYMRTTVLCRCKHGHEDVRELELDGQKAVFSASVYRKEEWEQKTKEKSTNENHKDIHTRKSILDSAAKCVCGDRDQQYGGPETSFRMIAELWEPYIRQKCVSDGADVAICAEDVAAMMVLFKMARVATGSYKADSWIDAAGYAACGGELAGGRDNG